MKDRHLSVFITLNNRLKSKPIVPIQGAVGLPVCVELESKFVGLLASDTGLNLDYSPLFDYRSGHSLTTYAVAKSR
jgi:hypothetical protein